MTYVRSVSLALGITAALAACASFAPLPDQGDPTDAIAIADSGHTSTGTGDSSRDATAADHHAPGLRDATAAADHDVVALGDASVGDTSMPDRSSPIVDAGAPDVTVSPQETGTPGVSYFRGTGSDQTYIVPDASMITIKAWGAGGGAGSDNYGHSLAEGNLGGGGGFVQQTFDVFPGQMLTVRVGQPGATVGAGSSLGGWGYASGGESAGLGWNGGGGGGATGVLAGSVVLLVAGGGGGGGGAWGSAPGGAGGGDPGVTGQDPCGTSGGVGGLPGNQGGHGGAGLAPGTAGGDGSATTGAGGAGGVDLADASIGGGLGGGGGGGYVGGGGGGAGGGCVAGGGGGGGSNHTSSANGSGPHVTVTGMGITPGMATDPDLPPNAAIGAYASVGAGSGFVVIRAN